MKRRSAIAAFLAALLPLACAKAPVRRNASVACVAITTLSDRFDALVESDVPFVIQQRMAFAHPEVSESFTKIVIGGRKGYATAIRTVSGESVPVAWSMMRGSQFLFGESVSEDVLPAAWESSGDLSGAKIPETVLGAIGLVKPKCETIRFDGSNQTFSFIVFLLFCFSIQYYFCK